MGDVWQGSEYTPVKIYKFQRLLTFICFDEEYVVDDARIFYY